MEREQCPYCGMNLSNRRLGKWEYLWASGWQYYWENSGWDGTRHGWKKCRGGHYWQ